MRDVLDDSFAIQVFRNCDRAVTPADVLHPSSHLQDIFLFFFVFCVYVRHCHPRLRLAQFIWNWMRRRTSKQTGQQKKENQDNTRRSVRRKTVAKPRMCVNSNSNSNYQLSLNASWYLYLTVSAGRWYKLQLQLDLMMLTPNISLENMSRGLF